MQLLAERAAAASRQEQIERELDLVRSSEAQSRQRAADAAAELKAAKVDLERRRAELAVAEQRIIENVKSSVLQETEVGSHPVAPPR